MKKSEIMNAARHAMFRGDKDTFEKYFTPDFKLSGSETWFCTADDLMTGEYAFEHYSRICRNDFLSFDVKTELITEIESDDFLFRELRWIGVPRENADEIDGNAIFQKDALPSFRLWILTKFRGDKICSETSMHNSTHTEILFSNGNVEFAIDKIAKGLRARASQIERVKKGEQIIPDPTEKLARYNLMHLGDFI
ncbi:hypothetical protein FACS1894109_16490 [Spirochaetia bacterium]|nr:hypothetical protein FACS1894109_16490 [Spirochaetia bacterium]